MSQRDHYDVLGVDPGAPPDEIKRAFRDLARRYHPDVAGDDPFAEERFKEINAAYAVLADPRKRRYYDRFGHAGAKAADGGFAAQAAAAEEYFGELVNELFSRARRGRRGGKAAPGRDLRYTLEVSFEDAATGITTDVEVPHPFPCNECHGSGAAAGTAPRPCPTCDGKGEIRVKRAFLSVSRDCPRCGGNGALVDKPCRTCTGRGTSIGVRTLPVTIPAGVEDGRVFHLKGQGAPGDSGGPSGDLAVHVKVRPHPFFRRGEGGTVVVQVPVGIEEATLGGEVEVPCLQGSVHMKIPPGTQTGRIFRLPGRGLPDPEHSGTTGDQHVVVVVETPEALDDGATDALHRFRDAVSGGQVRYTRRDEFRRKMEERDG